MLQVYVGQALFYLARANPLSETYLPVRQSGTRFPAAFPGFAGKH
jgi:hypothetical protein